MANSDPIKYLAIAAVLLLVAACTVSRGGLKTCPNVDFDVNPRHICLGEEAVATWAVASKTISCDTFYRLGFGEACLGTVTQPVRTYLVGHPSGVIDPGERAGHGRQAFTPDEPTTVNFFAFRERRESRTEYCARWDYVIPIEDEGISYSEVFRWGCNRDFNGGPGWETRIYEMGDVAGTGVRITRVLNQSPFDITLSMQRDRPDGTLEVLSADVAAFDAAPDTFSGPLEGLWWAAPADREQFGPSACGEEKAPTTGTVGIRGMPEPSGVSIPRPDVELVFVLTCSERGAFP